MRRRFQSLWAFCATVAIIQNIAYAQDPVAEQPAEKTVRVRLVTAHEKTLEIQKRAQVSDLAKKVEPISYEAWDREEFPKQDLPLNRFATHGDVAHYKQQRIWAEQYRPLSAMGHDHLLKLSEEEAWPRTSDAQELRELLADKDPAIRGLAIEALATLHDPDDVPRIAKLLGDRAESVPVLGWNDRLPTPEFLPWRIMAGGKDVEDLSRSWQPRHVRNYARAALYLMTGQCFNERTFGPWWTVQHGGKDRIWFWEQRLYRDFREEAVFRGARHGEEVELAQYRIEEKARFEAVRQIVAKELAEQSAEVELKVRLMALNRFSSAFGDTDRPFMGPFRCERVSTERLLELLERKNLWEEVKWDTSHYNSISIALLGQAENLFERKDVDRLRAVQAREKELSWNGAAFFTIGISRLLPPASPDNLDDPDTQDGVLRALLQRKADKQLDSSTKGAVAADLLRVGLPRNQDFLVDLFFHEDVKTDICREFWNPPFTPAKQEMLAKILLDERFEAVLKGPERRDGESLAVSWAMHAVNVYAGSEVISYNDKEDLSDPKKAVEVFSKVKEIIRQTLRPETPAQEVE